MTMTIAIPDRVYRVGYGDDVTRLPDWKRVGKNRFDDLYGDFRVLYMSESLEGAFIERFACYRANEEFATFEADFEWDDDDIASRWQRRELSSGTVVYSEYSPLFIGAYSTDRESILLNLTVDETARYLSNELGFSRLLTVGEIVGDDRASYPISRKVSRHGWHYRPSLAGLYSVSTIKPRTITNVTIYEDEPDTLRTALHKELVQSCTGKNEELRAACEYLGIRLQEPQDYFAERLYDYGA